MGLIDNGQEAWHETDHKQVMLFNATQGYIHQVDHECQAGVSEPPRSGQVRTKCVHVRTWYGLSGFLPLVCPQQ
jgi:hypothetical protein